MTSEPFTTTFDTLVQDALKRWHIPGISMSVVSSTAAHIPRLNDPTILGDWTSIACRDTRDW